MSTRKRSLDDTLICRLASDPGAWLSCDECFRLLDTYVDSLIAGEPSPELAAMANHLDACRACREEAQTVMQLAAADSGMDRREALARLRTL